VGPLVSTDWLAARLGDPGIRVVDVRWYLDPARQGRAAYRQGHIPGAVFLDVEADLSAPGGRRGGPLGRHPWPAPEQVSRVMGGIGVAPGVGVVAYDDQAGAVAARLWFLLRSHGHDDVAVLDGGIVKWLAEGRALETSVPAPQPAFFQARLRDGWVLGKREMLERDPALPVLDARAPERYRGEQEPIDLRAGHIPGARSAPYTANLAGGAAPVFRPPRELRERFRALGAEDAEPIVYCGSGVTACHDLLALELAGLRGRLYAGSWSEWSADPALPIETGAEA
jgi:thiosulfate/3-mercaptopyruvate sulfurtransferase